MKRFYDIVFALAHPSYWVSSHGADSSIDALLNRLMDEDTNIESVDEFSTQLGKVKIWTSNYPHGYGSIVINKCNFGGKLPYRRTRNRLYKYILKKLVETNE